MCESAVFCGVRHVFYGCEVSSPGNPFGIVQGGSPEFIAPGRVGTGGAQDLDDIGLPKSSGFHQGSPALFVLRVERGTLLNEQRSGLRAAGGSRSKEGRRQANWSVARAFIEQGLQEGQVAMFRRQHEGVSSADKICFGVGASSEEILRHSGLVHLNGAEQGGGAIWVPVIQVGTVLEEELGSFPVTVGGGDNERGIAVRVRMINVGAVCDEEPGDFQVTTRGGHHQGGTIRSLGVGGRAFEGGAGVGFRTMFEQPLDNGAAANRRGDHERRNGVFVQGDIRREGMAGEDSGEAENIIQLKRRFELGGPGFGLRRGDGPVGAAGEQKA